MGIQQVRLESVRRKTGGRIQLTPRVHKSGPVTTLCGQTLPAGTYAPYDGIADCTNCQRRSTDQGRISGAFFAQEEGSELLRLSLEQARRRKPEAPTSPPRLTVMKPVSGPFSAQEEAAKLLRLWLEKPRRRKPEAPTSPPRLTVMKPVAWPEAKP